MKRGLIVLAIAAMILVSTAGAYIYERSTIKGVGYRSHELAGQTSDGDSGQKVAMHSRK